MYPPGVLKSSFVSDVGDPVTGGRWVAEIYGCTLDVIEDAAMVKAALCDAVVKLGAPRETAHPVVYKFRPQGISAAVVSPVATVMIHTWPEDNASATLDLYFYQTDVEPDKVLAGLARAFGAREEHAFRHRRGDERQVISRIPAPFDGKKS